jgi:hypothetical protein
MADTRGIVAVVAAASLLIGTAFCFPAETDDPESPVVGEARPAATSRSAAPPGTRSPTPPPRTSAKPSATPVDRAQRRTTTTERHTLARYLIEAGFKLVNNEVVQVEPAPGKPVRFRVQAVLVNLPGCSSGTKVRVGLLHRGNEPIELVVLKSDTDTGAGGFKVRKPADAAALGACSSG